MDLNNNQILLLVILVAVIFFVFILPMIDDKNSRDARVLKEKFGEVSEIRKFDQNICSQQCCNQSQWPVEHMPKIEEEMSKYVGSNFSCNFGSGSGCLCVTKDDFNYLANRGKNSGNNTCSN